MSTPNVFKKKPSFAKTKEKTVEKYLCDEVKKLGGEPYKFVTPGRRNAPDRYCVFENNVDVFIEVKRPGEALRSGQVRESKRLTDRGKLVVAVSTKEQVDMLMQFVKEVLDETKSDAPQIILPGSSDFSMRSKSQA